MYQFVSETYAENLLESILSFRADWQGYTKPDEVNGLLELFPKVSLRQGHVLDYVKEVSTDGITLPIRHFARPAGDATWVPLLDAAEEPQRADVADELYQYLDYESSPEGLFEYAFFATDIRRPQQFGPMARLDEEGGGRVRFLVYTPAGWERIYYLESMAFSDGFVDQEAGEIVADLGMGQIF